MRLTTLMEILEREIDASPSVRSKLAMLVAERGQKKTAGETPGGRNDGGARQAAQHSGRAPSRARAI